MLEVGGTGADPIALRGSYGSAVPHLPTLLHTMQKLCGGIGAFAGSSAGWALGSHLSIFFALLLSMIGMGCGMYYGRKFAREHS